MTPARLIFSPEFRRSIRRIARELLICIVLPSALLIAADLVAQQSDPSQPQQSQQSQPQPSQDEQVVNAINSRLATSGLPNPLNFNVMVHGGVATLQGTVPTAEERQKAEAFMKSVPGVTSVDNQLTIGAADTAAPPPPPPPQQNEPMASPEDQTQPNQNPEDQNPEDQNPQQQEHAPGPPPPPPSNPYGPPPANEQNGPPPSYQSGNAANRNYSTPGRFQQPMVTIPVGKPVHVMMLNGIDSKHSKPGDRFRAVVVENVILPNGATALPRGAYVDGAVIDSRPPGKLKGHPKLALVLTNVHLGDATYSLPTYVWDRRGPGKGGETTGNVVGGAAVGTVAGGFAGGGAGALLGAAIGGLGGAGLSALSGGPRLVVPPESVLTFYLNAPATVREPTVNEMRSLEGNVPPPPGGYRRGPGSYGYPPPAYPPPAYPPPGPPGGYPY